MMANFFILMKLNQFVKGGHGAIKMIVYLHYNFVVTPFVLLDYSNHLLKF